MAPHLPVAHKHEFQCRFGFGRISFLLLSLLVFDFQRHFFNFLCQFILV